MVVKQYIDFHSGSYSIMPKFWVARTIFLHFYGWIFNCNNCTSWTFGLSVQVYVVNNLWHCLGASISVYSSATVLARQVQMRNSHIPKEYTLGTYKCQWSLLLIQRAASQPCTLALTDHCLALKALIHLPFVHISTYFSPSQYSKLQVIKGSMAPSWAMKSISTKPWGRVIHENCVPRNIVTTVSPILFIIFMQFN